MNSRKRLLTVVFTLALGFGVWTLAFTFQSASFGDGDLLSASELNALLNDNFQSASDAVDAQVDASGDTVTGRLNVEGAGESTGETGDIATMFRVESTATDSAAAVFESANNENSGAVAIKQAGSGPALSLKANGGGPLITAATDVVPRFIVDNDGSIRIGNLGTSGTDTPALHLDATNGTITNDVGSGLPVAFGNVSDAGALNAGTSNVTVTRDDSGGPRYRVTLSGVSYSYLDQVTVVTPADSGAVSARTDSQGGDLLVVLYDAAGTQVAANFHFVTFDSD